MTNIVTVNFRGDTLFAIERPDGIFVAVKPICDALGIEWRKQRARIRRDPILAKGSTMTVLPSIGGMQDTVLLRLDLINGWLFTIDESRVRDDETRQKVLAYKEECHSVLFRHFYGKADRLLRGEDAEDPADGTKVRMVSEARQVFGVPSAAQLWFKLGLPVVPAMHGDPRQGEMRFPPQSPETEDIEKKTA